MTLSIVLRRKLRQCSIARDQPLADAQDTLYAKYDDFMAMEEEWAESARDQIRAHPLAVVGIALVAGLLIGRLSR